jgi:small subunit ribosomal protein S6
VLKVIIFRCISKEEILKKYEIMFILDPKEDNHGAKTMLKDLLKEHGGEVLEEQELGLKKMAYPINKKDRGVYYLLNIMLDPMKNEILKRELNLKEFIMRYMIVTLSKG